MQAQKAPVKATKFFNLRARWEFFKDDVSVDWKYFWHSQDRRSKISRRGVLICVILIAGFLGAIVYSYIPRGFAPTVPNESDQQALQAMADGLLPLFNDMPSISVLIYREQDFEWSGDSSVACYVPLLNSKNVWEQDVILVRSDVIQKYTFHYIQNSLKHELIHAWLSYYFLSRKGSINEGHPRIFVEKAVDLNMDTNHITDAMPQDYLKETVADIQQNGYRFLPRVEELIREYNEKIEPFFALEGKMGLTEQQQKDFDNLFKQYNEKASDLRDEMYLQ